MLYSNIIYIDIYEFIDIYMYDLLHLLHYQTAARLLGCRPELPFLRTLPRQS